MKNRFAIATAVLAAALANNGTLNINYPSGVSQASFLNGLATGTAYVMLNDNDKLTEAAGDISLTYGASYITLTNASGYSWPAGTELSLFLDQQDGNDVVFMNFPIKLANVADGDVVTEIMPGIAGTLEAAWWVTTDPVTTAAKATTLNFEIDTTNCDGGTIALTSANTGTLGAVVQSAAFTGHNSLTPSSKLSVEAASTTAFAEGEGYIIARIRKNPAYAV